MCALSHLPVSHQRVRQRCHSAFTLVELLVAMTVLLILALMMVALANQTNNIWRSSRTRIEAFQGARNAFDRLTTNLNQATLNTYLDYYNSTAVMAQSRSDLLRTAEASNNSNTIESALQNFVPAAYDRASELQIVCGPSQDTTLEGQGITPLLPTNKAIVRPTHALFFACPLGHVSDPNSTTAATSDFKILDGVLNAVGYYVEFNNTSSSNFNLVPSFITPAPASYRYRLMELNQPSQNFSVYSASTFQNPNAWYSLAVEPVSGPPPYPPVIVLAENIVALIVHPKAANPTTLNPTPTDIAPNYGYDSKGYNSPTPASNVATAKNQLPPIIQVTLVAIDSDSATRLAAQYQTTAPSLVTTGMFTTVGSNGSQYTADLNTLQNTLQTNHLNYRVFVTDVSIPGAKWSQTDTY